MELSEKQKIEIFEKVDAYRNILFRFIYNAQQHSDEMSAFIEKLRPLCMQIGSPAIAEDFAKMYGQFADDLESTANALKAIKK